MTTQDKHSPTPDREPYDDLAERLAFYLARGEPIQPDSILGRRLMLLAKRKPLSVLLSARVMLTAYGSPDDAVHRVLMNELESVISALTVGEP